MKHASALGFWGENSSQKWGISSVKKFILKRDYGMVL